MNTQPDFEELLRLLEESDVSYIIVGGYAVAFYGYPRFTKDIDIFFDRTIENVEKLLKALQKLGFEPESIPSDLFLEEGNVVKFGIEPVRIDLLNTIDGVDFEEAVANKKRGHYGSINVSFIGKDALIKNKKASGRTQDLADIEKLEQS